MAALLLFAGGGHAASSRLVLSENGHTLNTAFPDIMGIQEDIIFLTMVFSCDFSFVTGSPDT